MQVSERYNASLLLVDAQHFARSYMADIAEGESVEIQGSASKPYILTNIGGVYSCTCPAWRNQSVGIERRTCKHLRKYRGEQAEVDRLGSALPAKPAKAVNADGEEAGGAAPPLLLAQTWSNDVDLSGWWMSEKLDGVRAYWDGKQFVSRLGNLYHAPDWFVEQLPSTPLDGELWLARQAFQRTVSIVRRQDKSDHWQEISYVVFDAPAVAAPFEERVAALQEIVASSRAKNLQLLPQQLCRNVEHLREELTRIEGLGGEGLMLREPGSQYQAGRSSTLLKVKTFHDAEARVLEHQAGAGRHAGRLGALLVELPNGTKFSVGTGFSDAQRGNPPAIGSTITFRYQELSDRGVPRFPSFVRLHSDAGAAPSVDVAMAPAKAKPVTAKANTPTAVSATGPAPRHFEFVEGTASKFWEIAIDGLSVTVRYGRIGTNGQTQTKTFPDAAAAARHTEKLVKEKTEKGYMEGS
jgi:DNA ligase-1